MAASWSMSIVLNRQCLHRLTICTVKYCRHFCATKGKWHLKANESFGSSLTEEKKYKSFGEDRVGNMMQVYEDFVGLTEVKNAQDKVIHAENDFLKVQEERRTLQLELAAIQTEVRTIGAELEKTHRTDPCYIDLVKKEHGILVVEKDMRNKLKTLDTLERDLFSLLSACVRESHEKERARAERTKYWSIIGSVIGAIIGISGSTINNHKRLKEMRAIVKESGENSAEYKEVADKVLASLSVSGLSPNLNANNNNSSEGNFPSQTDDRSFGLDRAEILFKEVNLQAMEILSNLTDIKDIVSLSRSSGDSDSNIVYVGQPMRNMLHETELKLERNARQNLVISVSVMGGLLTLGVSLIAYILKGS